MGIPTRRPPFAGRRDIKDVACRGRPKAIPARQVLTNGRHRTAAGTDSRGGRPACGNTVVESPQKRRCPMKTAPFEFEVESLMFDVDKLS